MIIDVINLLKTQWSIPKKAIHHGEITSFEFICQFEAGHYFPTGYDEYPAELIDFWREADGARLFLDINYGQWGLSIYSYQEIDEKNKTEKEERPEDFVSSDLILGQFIGDLDLLVQLSDGRIAVVTPMDPRSDWEIVGGSFEQFLVKYSEHSGEKFWEYYD